MKKNYIIIALAGFTLLTVSSGVRASENLRVFTDENSMVIRMEMSSPMEAAIDVHLYDGSNSAIYSDRIGRLSTFEESYDFSGLEDGTYKLVSEMGHMQYNRILNVNGTEVKISDSFYSFSPLFKMQDGLVHVQYINNERAEIGISIEDESGALFDSFYEGDEPIFAEAFAVDNLSRGSYTLKFISQGEFHTFEFEVD